MIYLLLYLSYIPTLDLYIYISIPSDISALYILLLLVLYCIVTTLYTTLYSAPSQSSRSARFPNRLSVGGRWNGKWGPSNRRLVDHRPMDQSDPAHPPARFSAFPGWELHHDWYILYVLPYNIQYPYCTVRYRSHVHIAALTLSVQTLFFSAVYSVQFAFFLCPLAVTLKSESNSFNPFS